MSDVEVATGLLAWFEFDREHVGTSRERWTLYGRDISHVAAASPAAFVALACVLRGTARDYGCDGFTARCLSSGDTLLTMAGGAKVIVPSTIASGIAHTIYSLIAESQRAIRARHERAIDALCALGEAVATVARAVLIGRVAAGRRIDVDMDGDAETGLTLTVFWNGATISRYTSVRPGFGRIVTTYSGESEDFAVEAVARLIEEAQR